MLHGEVEGIKVRKDRERLRNRAELETDGDRTENVVCDPGWVPGPDKGQRWDC